MKTQTTPMILHVYAQEEQHREVVISGTVDALLSLRALISEALGGNMCDETTFFTNDGEGYGVKILPLTDGQAGEIPLPYSNPFFVNNARFPNWFWPMVYKKKVDTK
ncbi:MAG: hypothetical protein KGL39_11830 [Patescibacteria group bacterium]|nr:hypothetical protein [Patescibacteria group bacterium]